MTLKEDVTDSVDGILSSSFQERDGKKVPTTQDITLSDGAVKLDAAFLYADLAGSSLIAKTCPWETTAKIIRAYLDAAVRIIRAEGGEIRSFDGDRVMGIFIGGSKRTSAVRSALKIKYATEQIIQPKANAKFASVRNNDLKIRQACGVDSGISRAVRAGVRSNNDLIWIGRPPSLAAKLSDNREHPYSTFISESVYKAISDEAKYSNGVGMWQQRNMTFAGVSEIVYRSSYYWSL